MAKQCLFMWGNVPCEGGGSFTLQPGTAPSRGTFRFRLGAQLNQFDRLTITDGSNAVRVDGCRVVRVSITSGTSGRYQELTIEDRRWRWQYARVWGDYNAVEHNVVLAATKKSARDMAVQCLQAMGETIYNVQLLPTNSYPRIDWDAELAPAALEQLASQYGLIVAPTFAGGVTLCKNGVGNRPPIDQRAMDATPGREPPVVPDQLVFEGGQTLWQHDLSLEPWGFESMLERSELKPFNDLTYKPATGWEKEDPTHFYGVTEKKREIAKACIWKVFKVSEGFQLPLPPSALPNGGSGGYMPRVAKQQVSNYYRVDTGELWRVLPLHNLQLSMFKKPDKEEGPAAQILGVFRDEKHHFRNNVATDPPSINDKNYSFPQVVADELIYHGGFSIDALHGIVRFGQPMYCWDRTGNKNSGRAAPKIRLRTSFGLRAPDSRAHLCQQYWYSTNQLSSRQGIVDVIKRPESIFEIASVANSSSTTNVAEYIDQARYYLQEQLNSYYPEDAVSVPYKGFVFNIGIDGAIRAVTWSQSEGGAGTTQVEYLNERPDLRISHRDLKAKIADENARIQAVKDKAKIAIDKRNWHKHLHQHNR